MSEAATPETGAMTREQAVASLVAAETAPEAPVEAAEEEEIEGEASPPEETPDEAEEPAEGEEEAEAEEPVAALEPPPYWKQEAKAVFAAMTPEQQAVVLAQEGPREEITAKVKAEAAAARQQADAELGKVGKLATELADFLPKAIETFQSRWGADPDWVAFATEHGAEAMTLAKAQHDQELGLLQRTAQATRQAEAQAQEAYVRSEFVTLAEIAPELADPTSGPALRTEVTKYLVDDGIDPSAIQNISAREMRIARKAMLYDRAQAALKAKPAPKPVAPVAKSPVRPAAAVVQASPEKRDVAALKNRFAQTANREDAAALIAKLGL